MGCLIPNENRPDEILQFPKCVGSLFEGFRAMSWTILRAVIHSLVAMAHLQVTMKCVPLGGNYEGVLSSTKVARLTARGVNLSFFEDPAEMSERVPN
jgi:hypothetical protein